MKSLWALWMLAALVGCSDDLEVFGEYRPCEVIAFTASLDNDVQAVVSRGVASYLDIEEEEWTLEGAGQTNDSRGALVSALKDLNVGIFGYMKASPTPSVVFNNASFTFTNNEDLLPDSDPKSWTDLADSLTVFAYAPRMEALTLNGSTFSYSVPPAVSEQKDIIASDVKQVPKDYEQYIPLTFNHILTGIRFKVGFDCQVKSLKVVDVYGNGIYTLGDSWSIPNDATKNSFDLIKGGTATYSKGAYLTNGETTLMMIPQLLTSTAKVVMEYVADGATGTVNASLANLKWEPGKLITYTINKTPPTSDYIYFDLSAGNVTITPTSYSGKVYVNGTVQDVTSGTAPVCIGDLKFYVYQSTASNYASTGWESAIGTGTCRIPSYAPVKVGSKFWSEFITNNPNVEEVIETWDKKENLVADKTIEEGGTGSYDENFAVRKVGRSSTPHYVDIKGVKDGSPIVCNLTIDNIYSRHQEASVGRTTGGLTFCPIINGSKLTVNLVGDNRFGAVHYWSGTSEEKNNQIVFQGSGSLTAAAVDFHTGSSQQSKDNDEGVSGYFPNYWCSAIGGNDSSQGNAIGIVFKGGTIFAGTTLAENCTAIGGGGNDRGVVTIEGGTVTAVAATTGTAIGGGIGFNSQGGIGIVNITGGRVFAYNLGNEWEIPSAAIGSAGSSAKYGGQGTVNISGNAYVYAQTALGTAIGGGSSKTQRGGSATINISGNCYVVAKSIAAIDKKTGDKYPAGNGIGGGTGGTGIASDSKDENTIPAYGGSATITIEGTPTIRTGSIGGGKTNNPNGKIGQATITVSGGDILGQFVMAGGAAAGKTSSFTLSGENTVISNSNVDDKEYYHVQRNGGAVYMEDGTFTMTGGTIRNCKADIGGAVYIKKSADALQKPTFIMSGGSIQDCTSKSDGGAVYLEVGTVKVSGDAKITRNLAQVGNGGAVYIKAGDFSMKEEGDKSPNITYNSALGKNSDTKGHGGGVYVTSESEPVNVEVLSGTIQHNTSDGNGGGICVDMAGTTVAANIKIGADGIESSTNPDITQNESVMFGGGLYANGEKAMITINGGIIMNNKVSNYVPNENVYNNKGTVTLLGGEVTHVIVTFDANAYKDNGERDETALLNGKATDTQKIVTNTQSYLLQPASITRNFYVLEKWNTRPDGTGKDYRDKDIMEQKEDITLYAQWKRQ